MNTTHLDQFTRACIECALWSSTDDDGKPLDRNYSASDIPEETGKQLIADCAKFQSENADALAASALSIATQGTNFWLNRVGAGSGFWDEYLQRSCDAYNREQAIAIGSRDFSERDALDTTCPCKYHVCQRLSMASMAFGPFDLYIGDDGQVHGSPLTGPVESEATK